MIVKIFDDHNLGIWSYGIEGGILTGFTSKTYLDNGIQDKILEHLHLALKQAEEELSFKNVNRILNVGSTTC